jgi:hypothetical protein
MTMNNRISLASTYLDFLDLLRERAHHLVPRRLVLPIEDVERQVLERNHEVVDKVEDLREGIGKRDRECGIEQKHIKISISDGQIARLRVRWIGVSKKEHKSQ